MTKIFISYRRADSLNLTGRIYDRLAPEFGKKNIFRDLDAMTLGRDFRGQINEALNQSDVVLVIIGRSWLTVQDEHGNRRLDNHADFVRLEVEGALARDHIPVIPVLVNGAEMSHPDQLPTSLRELVYKQNVVIRDDPDFHNDVTRLMNGIKLLLQMQPRPQRVPWWIVGLLAAALIVVGLGAFLLLGQDDPKDSTATPTNTEVAQENTPITTTTSPPTVVPTHTPNPTDTPTDTLPPTATLTDTPNPTNTLTATPTYTSTPSDTPTYTPTSTPQPTDTMQPTPIPTEAPIGFEPVTRNTDWTPIEQDFDGITMVLVPAGCFMMGNDSEAQYWDGEQWLFGIPYGGRQCFDKPFWLDKYEVTNVQYGSTGCDEYSSEPEQPRNCITWFDAKTFCEAHGRRLPSEREWEYATRGPDNLIYPWGNNFAAGNLVYDDQLRERTAEVGSKPRGISWVRAYDLLGNVREWTSSLYFDYPYVVNDGRETSNNTLGERVVRGGSWGNASDNNHASIRLKVNPSEEANLIGFRCARDY